MVSVESIDDDEGKIVQESLYTFMNTDFTKNKEDTSYLYTRLPVSSESESEGILTLFALTEDTFLI